MVWLWTGLHIAPSSTSPDRQQRRSDVHNGSIGRGNYHLMTGSRTKMLPWGGRKTGTQWGTILRSVTVQTATHDHAELVCTRKIHVDAVGATRRYAPFNRMRLCGWSKLETGWPWCGVVVWIVFRNFDRKVIEQRSRTLKITRHLIRSTTAPFQFYWTGDGFMKVCERPHLFCL